MEEGRTHEESTRVWDAGRRERCVDLRERVCRAGIVRGGEEGAREARRGFLSVGGVVSGRAMRGKKGEE